MLSIILATVFLNNSNIYAASPKKGTVNKDHELIQNNRTAIENALKNNDYGLFTSTLISLGISETISTEQFSILVQAYELFKTNKQDEAVKLLHDSKVNPILIKFINNRPDLTNAQKEILKQASDLIKQGKTAEAKTLITSSGLPQIPKVIDRKINKFEERANKEELKKAFNEARQLRKEGRIDEARKVLKDAGVPDQIQDRIRPEFDEASSTLTHVGKVGFLQSLKNLFIK